MQTQIIGFIFTLSLCFASLASADAPIAFRYGPAVRMFRYLQNAKVPLTLNEPNQRIFSMGDAACSRQTRKSEYYGGGDVTSTRCAFRVGNTSYGVSKDYEAGVEMLTILGEANGTVYPAYAFAGDVICKATRAGAAAKWEYACTASSVSGVEEN